MKNLGKILFRKFSSSKPSTGSKLLASGFGDIMKKSHPMISPPSRIPSSSTKEDEGWLYDNTRGVHYKYFIRNGKLMKQMKNRPGVILPWTVG